MYRGEYGGIITGEAELKVSVIITIRETLNCVCCNLIEERGGVGLNIY